MTPRELSDPKHKFRHEADAVKAALATLDFSDADRARIKQRARVIIEAVRAAPRKAGFNALIEEFSLTNREGLALMALAEALLRVPDAATAEAFIEDRLSDVDVEKLFGASMDWMSKLGGFGLKLTKGVMGSLLGRVGMPVIRSGAMQGIRLMGDAFVVGETIEKALEKSRQSENAYSRFSFDMLGEGARTMHDADTYFNAYKNAIRSISAHTAPADGEHTPHRPGISVKLSALHPRYAASQARTCIPALQARLLELCRMAAAGNIHLTIDAEEADRLALSLDIIDAVIGHPDLKNWHGLGLAVQAYQKRAPDVIAYIRDEWAPRHGATLAVRLVKGAYWDTEIKRAQVTGMPGYPVFTRKAYTDLSYLACARILLDARPAILPLFGTHNPVTVAAVIDMAGDDLSGFAFQRLYGMGNSLFKHLGGMDIPTYVYAPVGSYRELLAYLVRRLLENGANSSFVNRLARKSIPVDTLLDDVFAYARENGGEPHPAIPMPADIYRPERVNSHGLDIGERTVLDIWQQRLANTETGQWLACPIINGKERPAGVPMPITAPADRALTLGQMWPADEQSVRDAFATTLASFARWKRTPVAARAAALEKLADLIESNDGDLMSLLVFEAGKTIADGIAEIREAADFCRYYAAQARDNFAAPWDLKGPTGETNRLVMEGRGVFACISPWNFPLAIFTGQIAAALAAGNAVVAKPAEQTPLIAAACVRLMIKTGIPADVIALLPGDGRVGEMITRHAHVAGVAFTGSNAAAKSIQRALADKDGPIVPLIAETGGINAMIVDSTALPEQVCDDVITSAFSSAGQRCSALRLLCLQEDVADRILPVIQGAMETLVVGNTADLATDIGPIIDAQALANLQKHKSGLRGSARILAQTPLPQATERKGTFCAPVMAELRDVSDLNAEVFGPVLHVVRYAAKDRAKLVEALNSKGFGLTFGVHSRVIGTQDELAQAVQAGNVYVNRSMIGAVVGVQPFGGMGLSGTGPKAGGPHYLYAFATERVISTDTTSAGGNTSLVSLGDG